MKLNERPKIRRALQDWARRVEQAVGARERGDHDAAHVAWARYPAFRAG